ncbi:MAG: hypothetical protein ACR2N8_02990 [Parvibaculales bacterium]
MAKEVHFDKSTGVAHHKVTLNSDDIKAQKDIIERSNACTEDPEFKKKHGEWRLVESVPADIYGLGVHLLQEADDKLLGNIEKGKQNEVLGEFFESKTWKNLKAGF